MNTCSISNYDSRIPKICLAKTPTFGNWLLWIHHQVKGLAHVVGVIDNILDKDSSPTTSAHKDSSINAFTPNISFSFFMKSPNLATNPTTTIVHA
jgi:hypothetical protein